MVVHANRLAGPDLARVLEATDQFSLLAIHTDDRGADALEVLAGPLDDLELFISFIGRYRTMGTFLVVDP